MLRFACCLILVAWFSLSQAAAQRVVAAGDTVRIQILGQERRIDGVLQHREGGGLVVRRDGEDRSIVPSSVISVRVLDGRRPAIGRGALIGLATGAALGTVGGIAAAIDDDSFLDFGAEIIPVMVVFLGGTGALAGAVVGSFMTSDRWVPATMPVAPTAEGARFLSRVAPVIRPGAESSLLVGVRLGGR